MRILVISDIHANHTALEAVLNDAGTVDAVWCLGDLVGYGPDPNECVETIRSLPNLSCLTGNHDAAALGQIDLDAFNREAIISARWMQTNLNESSTQFMRNLPERLEIENTTLVHGSPRNPVWEYLLEPRTAGINFGYFTTQICLVGHTHLPVAFLMNSEGAGLEWHILSDGQSQKISGRAILNPGSVGQPRDHDPRAAYAIFDPDLNLWEPHRVEYDAQSVQTRILDAGLPSRHALRLTEGW